MVRVKNNLAEIVTNMGPSTIFGKTSDLSKSWPPVDLAFFLCNFKNTISSKTNDQN